MKTNSLPITNALAQGGTNDIRALKPPVEIPNVWPWVWGALAGIALAVIAYFIWRHWRKTMDKPAAVPVVPPHERARKKLREALSLIDQPKPFCILVSDTIRLYLEERFNFHAPERTTEEFLLELKSTDLLLSGQKESLGEFLSVCDMVKFAKYSPGLPELEALHQSASRLIDETEPQPEVMQAAPAAASQP